MTGPGQLDLLTFSLDARGAGHRVPILDTPDATHIDQQAPSWALSGLPARWWTFRQEHPDIEPALVRLARALLRKGHTRIGIAMLYETLRYETFLGSRPDEPGPRLNNDFRAYWARWLMAEYRDLDGVFEVRTSEAEKCPTSRATVAS